MPSTVPGIWFFFVFFGAKFFLDVLFCDKCSEAALSLLLSPGLVFFVSLMVVTEVYFYLHLRCILSGDGATTTGISSRRTATIVTISHHPYGSAIAPSGAPGFTTNFGRTLSTVPKISSTATNSGKFLRSSLTRPLL